MNKRTAIVCVVGLLFAVLNAGADEIQLGPSKDNTLYEDPNGSLSNGSGQYFFAGRTGFLDNKIRRGLVEFDLADAGVPSGATIDSVFLTLYMSRGVSGGQSVSLHRVLADWGEGTSDAPGEEGGGAPSASGDATWKHRSYSGVNWDNLGGDYTSGSSASRTVSTTGFYTWGSTPGLVADAQAWLDNPGTNFGWLLKGDETTVGSAQRFNARQDTLPDRHPALRIVYTPATNCSCPLQADMNANGSVDSVDLGFVVDAVFFGGADPQDPDCPTTRGDFDADGATDSIDLGFMVDYVFFGGTPPVDPCP